MGVNIRRNVSRIKRLKALYPSEIIPDSGGQHDPDFPENRLRAVEGWKIGQFVTNFFEISERSNAIENLIIERRELLSKSNKDTERLKYLDDQISKLPIGSEEDDKLLRNVEELYNKLSNSK